MVHSSSRYIFDFYMLRRHHHHSFIFAIQGPLVVPPQAILEAKQLYQSD